MTLPAAYAKICGITSLEHARIAAPHGAGMIGLVHFPRSPRHLDIAAGAELAASIRAEFPALPLVAVVVHPDAALLRALDAAWAPNYIQLHHARSAAEVAAVRDHTRAGCIVAHAVGCAADLADLPEAAHHADFLLLDAKPSATDTLPGGNGRAFDWDVLRDHPPAVACPWMLSGGLTPLNVAHAIATTRAPWVDVSSGVEYEAGRKNPDAIIAFLKACQP